VSRWCLCFRFVSLALGPRTDRGHEPIGTQVSYVLISSLPFSFLTLILFLLRDTVHSVGLIPRTLPFATSNTIVRTFRHALSLDERRARFKANLWNNPTYPDDIECTDDDQEHEPGQEEEPSHDFDCQPHCSDHGTAESGGDVHDHERHQSISDSLFEFSKTLTKYASGNWIDFDAFVKSERDLEREYSKSKDEQTDVEEVCLSIFFLLLWLIGYTQVWFAGCHCGKALVSQIFSVTDSFPRCRWWICRQPSDAQSRSDFSPLDDTRMLQDQVWYYVRVSRSSRARDGPSISLA
jgi:hypothetical protein